MLSFSSASLLPSADWLGRLCELNFISIFRYVLCENSIENEIPSLRNKKKKKENKKEEEENYEQEQKNMLLAMQNHDNFLISMQ